MALILQNYSYFEISCPFSLARMVSLTKNTKFFYRAAHPKGFRFPLSGDTSLPAGIPRNFELFDPLDFFAPDVA
jgi:hypothetical protein